MTLDGILTTVEARQRVDVRRDQGVAQRSNVGPDRLTQLGELVRGGGVGQPLAQGLGATLDLLDALQRGGDLGAGGGALTLAVALQALDGRGELGADRVRGLLVLGAHLLDLRGDLGAVDGGLGPAGGLGDRLGRTGLGGGDRLGQAGVGRTRLALERIDPRGQTRGAVLDRRLDLLQARLLLVAIELARHARQRPLQIGLERGGVTVGRQRPLLGLAARVLELRRQRTRDGLELVDALHRRQQSRDDRGSVVKIVEPALDARVGVGQALLGLGVGERALGIAAGELGVDPRRRAERLEDDQSAGGAALERRSHRLQRLLQSTDDDRVLLAHAQQHQVHRQLEGQVLQEQREVEALVELDRDEHGLDRERVALPAAARELDRAGHARRLARVEEPTPRLAGGRQRAADQRLEEPVAQDVLGRALEQQLGGLRPLGDGTLAVGEDEVSVDDLPQQRVERVGDFGQDLVGRVMGRRRVHLPG